MKAQVHFTVAISTIMLVLASCGPASSTAPTSIPPTLPPTQPAPEPTRTPKPRIPFSDECQPYSSVMAYGSPVAPDGHAIACLPGGHSSQDILVIDLLTGGQTTYHHGILLRSLFWLPDNHRILYSGNKDENFTAHLLDLEDGTDMVIMESEVIFVLDISPDGEWMLVKTRIDGPYDLVIEQIDGEESMRLTDDEAEEIWAAWSPDGEWIAIGSSSLPAEPMTYWTIDRVYLLNPFSGEEQELNTTRSAYDGRWSPDSSQLIYRIIPGDTPGESFIPTITCVLDIATGEEQCSEGEDNSPPW